MEESPQGPWTVLGGGVGRRGKGWMLSFCPNRLREDEGALDASSCGGHHTPNRSGNQPEETRYPGVLGKCSLLGRAHWLQVPHFQVPPSEGLALSAPHQFAREEEVA